MSETTLPGFPWGAMETLACGFTFADGEFVSSDSYGERTVTGEADDFTITFSGAKGLPDLSLEISCTDTAVEMTLVLTAAEAVPRPIRWLHVLDADVSKWLVPREALWMFRHGTTSPGDSDICVPLASGEADGMPEHWRFYREDDGVETYTGESAILPRNLESGEGALFGFVTLERQATRIEIHAEGGKLHVAALSDAWDLRLGAGDEFVSERLRVESGDDDHALLDSWVSRIAELAEPGPRILKDVPTGWSDWQYYRREISEADVLENLRAITEEGLPFEYLIVDDGFQSKMSDWLVPNERWPSGIAAVGAQIAGAGLKPGVWLAPLTAAEHSDFAREHRDWLLKNTEGEPNWHESHMGRVCAVDFTVPEALRWLGGLIHTFVDEYGFRWIKLDGPIARYYEGGRFARAGVTQTEVIRSALEMVRNAAGDAVVEGEGYYGPSIGLVEVQRVTQDIQTSWPELRLCTQSNCLSGHFHQRLWANNPETFILRDVASPHYDVEKPMGEDQLLLQITALALSGGVAEIADPIALLSPGRKALLATCFPPYPRAARPVRLFEGRPCPEVYALDVERPFGSWRVLAAYNWDGEEKDIAVTLPEGESHVFDFWKRLYLGVHERQITLCVPSHGVRLISARRVTGAPIELVGTGIHVTQGAVELHDVRNGSDSLTLETSVNCGQGGSVFVRSEMPVKVADGDASVFDEGEGVYRVDVAPGCGQVFLTRE